MIDRLTVERVADLARLGLTEEEKSALQAQLSRIVDYVDVIGAVVTTAPQLAPSASLRLRPDSPGPSLPREVALGNALEVESGFIRVPAVLD